MDDFTFFDDAPPAPVRRRPVVEAKDTFSFFDDDTEPVPEPVSSPSASVLIPPAWKEFLQPFLDSTQGKALLSFIDTTYESLPSTTFPPKENIFRAFQLVDPANVKVVCIAQDPYHNQGAANGLAFSCNGRRHQPSLVNIFKELKDDVGVQRLEGNLDDWARQGVLLINKTLMVQKGKANSYEQQWQDFAPYVIKKLMRDYKKIVFLVWGGSAKSAVRPYLQYKIANQHVVHEAAHPSPLSAYKGFFGSKPFSKANRSLQELGREPIQW